MHPKKSLIWLVLLPAMLLPFISSLFYFVLFTDSSAARLIYTGTKIFTLVWPLIAVYAILRLKREGALQSFKWHLKSIPLGLFFGGLIVTFIFGVMQTPVQTIVEQGTSNIRQKAESLGILEHYWLFALFLALIHSLIEEYYWRWFVFGQLKQVLRTFPAHLLAGLAFASHHIVIATQFFPFWWGVIFGLFVGVGGIIWSWMYEKQQSLMGSWISHLLVDLGILGIGHKLLFGSYFGLS